MAKIKRLFTSFSKLLLPVVLLVVVAVVSASVWLVHITAHPHVAAYLVTPEKYGMLSSRGAQVTEETWQNHDGTTARGWLLRGTDNAPGVILLHKYGADRSHALNLGVKLSEATNFTILMPDLRAHGQNPSVKITSFGGSETEDALAAIAFLKRLKTPNDIALVGQQIGVYGIEMGAVAALGAAAKDPSVAALVLDSVPRDSDAVLASAVGKRFPFASSVTSRVASLGTNFYFYDGSYKGDALCDAAKLVANRQVILFAGTDAPDFQDSTNKLSKCFPGSTNPETKTDLSPSGYSIINASLEQAEAYDQRVIDFFRVALGSEFLTLQPAITQ